MNITPSSSQKDDFYGYYLEKVSRSFYFCIDQLQPPLKEQIGLLYLFCRILDCIEDYKFKDDSRKWQQFEDFETFFIWNEKEFNPEEYQVNSSQNAQVLRWAQRFPDSIKEEERQLIKITPQLIKDFYRLSLKEQKIFKNLIFEMSEGMQKYVLKKHQLKDIHDVNEYCYYVAGVVGHGLTQLVALLSAQFVPTESLLKESCEFGLFLQKVNLLKDQKEDEISGRFLVPHREEVLLSLIENAQNSMIYIEKIPLEIESYRKFCAWSLFLGLASLPYIQESYVKEKNIKISRLTTKRLIQKVSSKISQPEKLRALFDSYLEIVRALSC